MKSTQQAILPVVLPPSVLRPTAFRIFTKKHSLTVTSASLQTLASFVGTNCGSGWREEGLAELLLDEIARVWKNAGGGIIVEESPNISLKELLDKLESRISHGRILPTPHEETTQQTVSLTKANTRSEGHSASDTTHTFLSLPDSPFNANQRDQIPLGDPENWIKVISAFNQPRVTYSTNKRNFEPSPLSTTFFSSPSHRVLAFHDRYNRVYQRVLRNKAFQEASVVLPVPRLLQPSSRPVNGNYNVTLISSLQGRSGISHLVLGLLHLSPVGEFCLSDLTGTIALDLQNAKGVAEDEVWFVPGMVLLVDGIYEEGITPGSQIRGTCGIGGTIDGRFIASAIASPPCERREISLGISQSPGNVSVAVEGFGWTDFLGVGSVRAEGSYMRDIQQRYSQLASSPVAADIRTQLVIMSEINLDNPRAPEALKNVFKLYNVLPIERTPLAFLLIGNFAERSVMDGEGGVGIIEYKELFDRLAAILSEFSRLLQNSTFIFVPGNNDPWASSFCIGAAPPIPRGPIPSLFTSRIRRAFSAAKEVQIPEAIGRGRKSIWTSNPARVSIFGPLQELVVFRDDVSDRLRRASVNFQEGLCQKLGHIATAGAFEEQSHDDSIRDIMGSAETLPIHKLGKPLQARANHLTETDELRNIAARKLVKSLLDQGHLSPFPTTVRPILWDHASALHLYPLPTSLILADPATGPFVVTYEGCHVINPGRLMPKNSLQAATWAEYNVLTCKSCIHEEKF
ncbi:DNA-directed DNA polymerase epsilon, subunit B [Emydomyces testavorans]|uniref:DNA polymerase epsilon subunit B n=1 Tax=Emydomyces testavorans TaxID=2070801 RepID=A0AAF0DC75_9EURO|nr:DNA-directed DNA polymerase epsilon, subunit B [Emydomyces testavorans]